MYILPFTITRSILLVLCSDIIKLVILSIGFKIIPRIVFVGAQVRQEVNCEKRKIINELHKVKTNHILLFFSPHLPPSYFISLFFYYYINPRWVYGIILQQWVTRPYMRVACRFKLISTSHKSFVTKCFGCNRLERIKILLFTSNLKGSKSVLKLELFFFLFHCKVCF